MPSPCIRRGFAPGPTPGVSAPAATPGTPRHVRGPKPRRVRNVDRYFAHDELFGKGFRRNDHPFAFRAGNGLDGGGVQVRDDRGGGPEPAACEGEGAADDQDAEYLCELHDYSPFRPQRVFEHSGNPVHRQGEEGHEQRPGDEHAVERPG